MIAVKNPEHFRSLLPLGFFNTFISFQDTPFLRTNQQLVLYNITQKQKDFIIQNNQEFYSRFKNVYMKNKELKNKLDELTTEKKRLKNNIINLDKKLKKNIYLNNNEKNKNNKEKSSNFSPYRKRIRRKKVEINDNYECTFPNCNKKYLTKCSLNMHIKLKHKKEKLDEGNKDN